MLKIAVVGSGYWGKNLVRNFHDLGALSAVCDKDPLVVAKFQEMFQDISTVQDFDRLCGKTTCPD